MPPTLRKDIKFEIGSGMKKYRAIIPRKGHSPKIVNFGDRRYGHYKDQVPISQGGGLWTSKDHLDEDRRKSYRARHAAIKDSSGEPAYKKRHSPAWFSYYFLW